MDIQEGHNKFYVNDAEGNQVAEIVFVPTGEHHNQRCIVLDKIHTPTGPEMFPHFKHTVANWLNVAAKDQPD